MKPKAIIVSCSGAAHRNPFIDNCYSCMPFWSRFPECPNCHLKLSNKGLCRKCLGTFVIDLFEGVKS